MIEFLMLGSAAAYCVNRFVLGKPAPAAQPPPPTHQIVGGVALDVGIEPRTAEGVTALLARGSAADCETAALSLLRNGLPLASRQCADRAASLRARERFAATKAAKEKEDAAAAEAEKAKLQALDAALKGKADAAPAASE